MILAQQPGQHRPQTFKQQFSSRPALASPRPGAAQPAGLQLQIPRQGTSSASTSPEKLLILMGQGKESLSPGKAKTLTPSDRQDVANILANLSGIMVEPADSVTTSKVASPRPLGGLIRPSLTVSTTDKRPNMHSGVSPGTMRTSPGSSSVKLKVSPVGAMKTSSVSPKAGTLEKLEASDIKVSKE